MCIDKAQTERLWLRFAFCFRCFAAVSWSSTVSQLLMKRRVSVSGTTTNTCFIPSSERVDLLNSCFVSINSCWNRWSTVWRSWRASSANSLVQRMRNSSLCQHWQVIMSGYNNCFTNASRITGTRPDPAIQGRGPRGQTRCLNILCQSTPKILSKFIHKFFSYLINSHRPTYTDSEHRIHT